MADYVKHKQQAEHNYNLAKELFAGTYKDWVITCSFYSALHFVESALLKGPPKQHSEILWERVKQELGSEIEEKSLHAFRERLVAERFKEIRTQYSQLRHMSEAVRYLEKSGGKCGYEFITEQVAKKALGDLKLIKSHLDK